MSCNLDKYTTYPLANVKRDVAEGRLVVKLDSPTKECPEGIYTSKKAELRVLAGSEPVLTYDTAKNRAVVTVPSKSMVQEINVPEAGFGTFLLWALGLSVVGWVLYRMFFRKTTRPWYTKANAYAVEPTNNFGASYRTGRRYAPAGDHTTIVNNDNSSGVLTGILLNEAMHSHDTPNYKDVSRYDNDTVEESKSDSYSSDSGSSYSSSSDDSYSSSSSSYSSDSSDSGSSYSSDSGSSYDSGGSDSGGSFSSD